MSPPRDRRTAEPIDRAPVLYGVLRPGGGHNRSDRCLDVLDSIAEPGTADKIRAVKEDDWGLVGAGRRVIFHDEAAFSLALVGNARLAQQASSRDKEVSYARSLATSYRQRGGRVFSELHGPFAVVLRLKAEDKLVLAIDRFGVFDLFYAVSQAQILVSTNLGLIQTALGNGYSVSPQSIFHYLYFHTIPSPGTIYENAFRVQPGCCVEVAAGQCVSSVYWRASYGNEHGVDRAAEMVTEFKHCLKIGVERELSETDRVGCFLSGGTDSSTVVGVVRQVSEEPPQTYSIGFDAPGYDEMEYARIAARHFQSVHHEYYVTPSDVVDIIPEMVAAYGQPFGNSSVVPTYFCARMARRDGMGKLLGGDGGDELFGGNERYTKQMLFALYDRIPKALRDSVIEPLVYGLPVTEKFTPMRKLRRYIEQALEPMPGRLESYNHLYLLGFPQVLSEAFLSVVDVAQPTDMLKQMYGEARADDMLNKMLALDLKLTLADNDLRKVTGMCELAGIDVGFPLLSEELAAFSMKLPVNQKVRRFRLRYFFKRALRDFLPAQILKKRKHGFGLPFGFWLSTDPKLRELAFDSLSDLKRRGIVHTRFIDELLGPRLSEHAVYYGGLVWVFMVLERWLACHTPRVEFSAS